MTWNIGNKKWTTWNKLLNSSRVAISRFSYAYVFLLYLHASQSVLSCKVPKRISRKMAVPNATHRNGQEPPLLQGETSLLHPIPVSSTSTESTVKLTHEASSNWIASKVHAHSCQGLGESQKTLLYNFRFALRGQNFVFKDFRVYSIIAWHFMHHLFSCWIDLDFKSGFWMMSSY